MDFPVDDQSVTPSQGPESDDRSWKRHKARWIAGAGGLTVVLGFAGYGAAALTAPAASTNADAASTATSSGGPAIPATAGSDLAGLQGYSGLQNAFAFGASGLGDISLGSADAGQLGTVSSVSTGSLTVSYQDGSTRTFTTNSSTTYLKDGTKASASVVSVGDHVVVVTQPRIYMGRTPGGPVSNPSGATPDSASSNSGSPPPASSGSGSGSGSSPVGSSNVATTVDVVSPSVVGKVVSVANDRITVEDAQGFWHTVRVSSSTAYELGGQPATSSAVATGEQVVARGSVDPNHTDLDASSVDIVLPQVTGRVTSVSGTTITLQGAGTLHGAGTLQGGGSTSSITVDTTPATVFEVVSGTVRAGPAQGGSAGSTSPGSLADVKVGDFVTAEGQKSPDGTVTATTVSVLSLPVPMSPPAHPGTGGFAPGHAPFGNSSQSSSSDT